MTNLILLNKYKNYKNNLTLFFLFSETIYYIFPLKIILRDFILHEVSIYMTYTFIVFFYFYSIKMQLQCS